MVVARRSTSGKGLGGELLSALKDVARDGAPPARHRRRAVGERRDGAALRAAGLRGARQGRRPAGDAGDARAAGDLGSLVVAKQFRNTTECHRRLPAPQRERLACGSAAPSRASGSARSSTAWRRNSAWPAGSSTRPAAWSSRSTAPPAMLDRLPAARRARAAAARGHPGDRVVAASMRPASPAFEIRASEGGEKTALVLPDIATCPDCLRRDARPAQPPLPLPVHQLHQLRAALHDHRGAAVRPAEHDDGRIRDVRRVPARVSGPERPPLPRAAERLPGLRPAARAVGRGTVRCSPPRDEALREAADDRIRGRARSSR